MSDDYEKLRATIKPLPCPFCGEELAVHSDRHGEWLAHRNSPLGDCFDNVAQLFGDDDIRRWNRRSSASPDGEPGNG